MNKCGLYKIICIFVRWTLRKDVSNDLNVSFNTNDYEEDFIWHDAVHGLRGYGFLQRQGGQGSGRNGGYEGAGDEAGGEEG